MSRRKLPALITFGSIVIGGILIAQTIFGAQNVTSSVTVGNSAPTVSGVTLNGGSAITLITPNGTTSVSVAATVADNNGCTDLSGGTTTILLYRAGVTSSTCLAGGGAAVTNLNCYVATAFTSQSSCTGTSTSITATTTFNMYYFAQATDGSSTYSGQGWKATVMFKDPSNATGSSDSAAVQLNTLNAINVTPASLNYGTLSPNSVSPISTTSVSNAGNSSTTLQLSASPTLTSGSNVIATSSQHYATSTFSYGGAEQQLSGTGTAVPNFTLTAPTSLTVVSGTIYWGLQVPLGTPTGTYTGTNAFTGVFSN